MSRENRHCAARAFCWVFLVPRGCQAQTCWKQVCCQCKRTFFTIPPPPKNDAFPTLWDGKTAQPRPTYPHSERLVGDGSAWVWSS